MEARVPNLLKYNLITLFIVSVFISSCSLFSSDKPSEKITGLYACEFTFEDVDRGGNCTVDVQMLSEDYVSLTVIFQLTKEEIKFDSVFVFEKGDILGIEAKSELDELELDGSVTDDNIAFTIEDSLDKVFYSGTKEDE